MVGFGLLLKWTGYSQAVKWHLSLTDVEGAINDSLTGNCSVPICFELSGVLHYSNSGALWLPLSVILEHTSNSSSFRSSFSVVQMSFEKASH